MTEQKPKFRDHLEKFVTEHYGAPISSLTEMQRSEALTLCYLLSIQSVSLPGSVPDDFEELSEYICDGQYDRTADFIFRSDDNHVTIIQAKHRSPQKPESEPDFDSFRRCLIKLCPETRPKDAKINQKVLDLSSDIDWTNDTFSLVFLSLARTSDPIVKNASQDLENVADSPLADISDRSDLSYLSEDEINKEWRDVVGQLTGVTPTVELLLTQSENNTSYYEYRSATGASSFIGALSAAQIHNLYTRYRNKLFNLNIRNYIGDTRTNKDIIRTADGEAPNFFLYNNGISAVARKVDAKTNSLGAQVLVCTDFSIINGAQTFRSISKAHSKTSGKNTKALNVLIRVSQIDFNRQQEANVLDKITRYNNTQNSMKLSDFRSNDPVQQSLVHYVSDINAHEGRKYLYRNKRTQAAERNKIPIKMDDFCRAVFAFQFGPIDVFGGQTYLYDTKPDGGYVKLFGKDLSALSQTEFDRLFGIWLICYQTDLLLKEDKKSFDPKPEDEADLLRKSALERKFLVFFAVGEILREVARLQSFPEASLFRFFAKPKWQLDEKKLEYVQEIYSLGADMVVQAYQLGQKTPGFVHRNFFRDPDSLSSIRAARASRKGQLQQISKRFSFK